LLGKVRRVFLGVVFWEVVWRFWMFLVFGRKEVRKEKKHKQIK